MTSGLTTRLIKLSESSLALEPTEDTRARRVVDRNSEQIGQIDDLIIDEREVRVRLIEVATFGEVAGRSRFHLPVDVITWVDERTVSVQPDYAKIDSGPQYKPDVINQEYLTALFSHYGCMPFWQDGYVYPTYPYYAKPAPYRIA
jgi:hypothetical protein